MSSFSKKPAVKYLGRYMVRNQCTELCPVLSPGCCHVCITNSGPGNETPRLHASFFRCISGLVDRTRAHSRLVLFTAGRSTQSPTTHAAIQDAGDRSEADLRNKGRAPGGLALGEGRSKLLRHRLKTLTKKGDEAASGEGCCKYRKIRSTWHQIHNKKTYLESNAWAVWTPEISMKGVNGTVRAAGCRMRERRKARGRFPSQHPSARRKEYKSIESSAVLGDSTSTWTPTAASQTGTRCRGEAASIEAWERWDGGHQGQSNILSSTAL